MDALALARAAAQAMWADDAASRALGMELITIEPGHAVMAMTVTADMVNGHDRCHGGYIFMLADSAFAFACNSHNQRNVGQHCHISYLAPAKLGDRLVANAVERLRAARSGIYDITVTLEQGGVIAEMRGHSRAIEGELVPAGTSRATRGPQA